MKKNTMLAYSAFVYEDDNQFIADCSALSLVSSGFSAIEAMDKLKNNIEKLKQSKNILITPVFERR